MRFIEFISTLVLVCAAAVLLLGSGALAMPQQVIGNGADRVTQNIQNDSAPNISYNEDSSNTSALNWSGYVATDGTYTSVSGSWTVPTVTNASGDVADATWVGIGGV